MLVVETVPNQEIRDKSGSQAGSASAAVHLTSYVAPAPVG
ncbi:hypothetical protein ABIE44_003423 [Marmoricola sp. OAE513]